MQCSPSKENQKLSCYSRNSLLKIAKEYNKLSPGNIKTKGKTKAQLWSQIRKALSNKCDNNEKCWIEQNFIKKMKNKEILNDTFRPKMPKEWKNDMTTWLTTGDINKVMKQYENKYPDFIFIGPVPLDCGINSNLRCELTKFNIKKLYNKGINKIGIIYNLDRSTGAGSHWMGLYVGINKKTANIDYYDSYGASPPYEIKKLMNKLQSDLKNNCNINATLHINNTRHQYDGYNCGMYSMYFIVKRLEGRSLKQIENMNLTTNKMQKLKLHWYRD